MAEATGLRNNALPYPIYGAPWGVVFPLLDADGDPISPSSQDSERSLNGDTFADCTNEAVEIATSTGICYLLLTAAEMTADAVGVRIISTGAKTTVLALYPRKLVTIRSGTSASAGSATSTIVLDASASAIDDFYNGMVCIATIDSNVEVRVISDYTGSTQTATVVPDWNVAPDNTDTFVIKLPEGVQLNQANATHFASQIITAGAGVTLPATVASTTNITAGTITTVTNLTNAPTAGDLTATMKTSVTTAATAATPVAASVTGAVGSVTGNVGGNVTGTVGSVVGAVGSVTGNVGGNVVGTVASVVGAVGSVTGLTAADVGAIKAKTDSLTFTVAGQADANIQSVNNVTVNGDGQSGTEWGP